MVTAHLAAFGFREAQPGVAVFRIMEPLLVCVINVDAG
jgi:hypothetical protein